MGMALGPIPFTAIVEYFKIYGLSDFDEFSYVIRRMDRAYLDLNKDVKGASKPDAESNKKNNS